MNFTKLVAAFPAILMLASCHPAALPAAETQASPDETTRLVSVLTSDASVFDKAKACQRLAVIGDESAVPALAALLADDQLSNYARHGLQAMPYPAADAALRKALGRLEGDLLIGVINSLGKRRCGDAVEDLHVLLAGDNNAAAEAAARALGNVGNPKSAEILIDALKNASPEKGLPLANAALVCGQRLLQQKDRAGAVKLFETVRTANVAKHLVLAATCGVIIARGEDGVPLLVEQLESEDEARFRLALQAARQLDVDVSPQLIAQFGKQPPERQALLLLAMGDLGAAESPPMIIKAARNGEPEVRVQALRVLARLDDSGAVVTLLGAALDSNQRVAQAAQMALAASKSDQIDNVVVSMLHGRDADKVQVAIDLSARRGIAAATPALLKLADSPDAALRIAAIKALGSTIGLNDLPKLLARTRAADTPEEISAARGATRATCVRMPQDKCAALLASGLADADAGHKIFLMEQLALVGGPTALEVVVAAAQSNDDASQDAATRALGEWSSADAAPALFELAQSLKESKYRIRALRGYVRIARQLDMPTPERMEVCRNTLRIAERKDEKRLVLDVLRRQAAREGLPIAASLLDDAELKEAACGVIVSVAVKVLPTAPAEADKALRQVLEKTRNKDLALRAKELIASVEKPDESK